MQPIVHFLSSVVAGLCVGLHLKNKIKKCFLILILALITTCIDLDHLLPIYEESGIKILHNMFVLIFFPVGLFLIFYIYEQGKGTSIKQRSCLLLCITFSGHFFLDAISDGLPVYYPLSSESFTVGNIGISIHPIIFTLTSEQVIIIIWGIIIGLANFYETLTYNEIELKKPFKFKFRGFTTIGNKRKGLLPTIVGEMNYGKIQVSSGLKTCYHSRDEKSNVIKSEDALEYIGNFVKNLPN